MAEQFIFGDPFERGAFEGLRPAPRPFAQEKLQVNRFFFVGMSDFLKQFAHGDGHAQLFSDFSDEALLKGFGWFAFATGKFPKPAQMRTGVPLRY